MDSIDMETIKQQQGNLSIRISVAFKTSMLI